MSPKEKAAELIEKFSKYAHWDDGASNNDFNSANCAMIAVDEILNINSVDKDLFLSDYWYQVKQELEKL